MTPRPQVGIDPEGRICVRLTDEDLGAEAWCVAGSFCDELFTDEDVADLTPAVVLTEDDADWITDVFTRMFADFGGDGMDPGEFNREFIRRLITREDGPDG